MMLLLSLTSCGDTVQRECVLKLGHGLSTSHPVHQGLERMNDELIRLSDSTMRMDIYPSEQLGAELRCIELLQIGSVDVTKVSAASLEGFVEQFKIFGIPYMFRSREHYDRVVESEVGDQILASTEPYWIRGLAYFDSGARSIYTVSRPISTPEDLKGMKIRVMKSPIAVEMMNTLGGSATPVEWGELYTALQSNVVDGAENNTPSITTAYHHEVAKYLTLTEHTYSPDVIIISSKRWAKLSPQQREWITEAARLGSEYQAKLWGQLEVESLEQVREKGIEIITPDKEPFIKMAQPMKEKYRNEPNLKSLIEKIDAL